MRIMILAASLLVACSNNAASQNCASGQIPHDGGCATLCESSGECPISTCCDDGLCLANATCIPEIISVSATGSMDNTDGHLPNHVVDRLVIDGQNLLGATAFLALDNQEQALEPCAAATLTQMVVALPDDVVADNYTLSVRNQAGACNTTLPLAQGERGSPDTGADILVKLAPVDGAGSGLDADTLRGEVPAALVPVGTVIAFAGDLNALPAGWLVADGRAVSRSQYPALFAAVQVRFGPGDSVTTFNLPNLTDDRFPMGVGTGRLGEVGGNNAIASDGSHTHTFADAGYDTAPDGSNFVNGVVINAAGNHNHGGDKRPRYLGVVYIIRAS